MKEEERKRRWQFEKVASSLWEWLKKIGDHPVVFFLYYFLIFLILDSFILAGSLSLEF